VHAIGVLSSKSYVSNCIPYTIGTVDIYRCERNANPTDDHSTTPAAARHRTGAGRGVRFGGREGEPMSDRESAFGPDPVRRSARSASGEAADGAGTTDGAVEAVLPDRDPTEERDRIRSFIAERVETAGADGVVVTMSGGLDSTVTAAVAVEALGPDHVYGLVLPCNKIGAPSARDAEALAAALGIDHDTVHLQPLFAQLGAVVPDEFGLHADPVRSGNTLARLRMAVAYLAAEATNALVCGTANRSELVAGYLTKHGDDAVDLLPLGHLYKTDVRALAAALDVPEFVVDKPPSAEFLPGHRDADDLGAPYRVVDPVFHLGVDRGLDPDGVVDRIRAAVEDRRQGAAATDDPGGTAAGVGPDADEGGVRSLADVDRELVADLLERHRRTAHKRLPAPTPDRRLG